MWYFHCSHLIGHFKFRILVGLCVQRLVLILSLLDPMKVHAGATEEVSNWSWYMWDDHYSLKWSWSNMHSSFRPFIVLVLFVSLKGKYTVTTVKERTLASFQQQVAEDFIRSRLYGPGTCRTTSKLVAPPYLIFCQVFYSMIQGDAFLQRFYHLVCCSLVLILSEHSFCVADVKWSKHLQATLCGSSL